MQVALASFYENDTAEQENNSNEDGLDEPIPIEDDDVVTEITKPVPTLATSVSKPKSKPAKTNSRFATVHSLSNPSSDEEEGQAFYAGGSEHSGQQVIGPGKKKDIVDEMFKSVQE